MRGIERLAAVDRSVAPMAQAIPTMSMEESVMVRLVRITVVGMGQFFEPVFRAMGLTESALHVLCLLIADDQGQGSPSELSDLVGTSRANMTRILDLLVEDGLVTRTTEARDGRRQVVQVTALGRRTTLEAAPKLAGPLEQAFAGLSRAEFAQLEVLLRKCIRSFDQSPAIARAPARRRPVARPKRARA